MADSLDTISSLTGLKRDTMLDLLAEVRANQSRLDACTSHDFVDVGTPAFSARRFMCRHCGGWTDSHAFYWYQKGLEHGRRRED